MKLFHALCLLHYFYTQAKPCFPEYS